LTIPKDIHKDTLTKKLAKNQEIFCMFVMWKKLMRELLEKEEIKPLNVGKIIKGKILSKEKGQVLVDLSPWGTGKNLRV
jgi:hypothetical protein